MSGDVQDYFKQLKVQCDAIFTDTSKSKDKLGEIHHFATRLFELSQLISDKD